MLMPEPSRCPAVRSTLAKAAKASAHSIANMTVKPLAKSRGVRVVPKGLPKDDGCAIGGPSCVECPLPICVFDLPAEEQRA